MPRLSGLGNAMCIKNKWVTFFMELVFLDDAETGFFNHRRNVSVHVAVAGKRTHEWRQDFLRYADEWIG